MCWIEYTASGLHSVISELALSHSTAMRGVARMQEAIENAIVLRVSCGGTDERFAAASPTRRISAGKGMPAVIATHTGKCATIQTRCCGLVADGCGS